MAKAGDIAFGDVGDHRVLAKFIAGMVVGHVDLDNRTSQDGQRIAHSVAVVRPGAGVDDNTVNLVHIGLVDTIDQCAFAIGLKVLHCHAQFTPQCAQAFVDLV